VTVPNQRDPDLVQVIDNLQTRLAALEANVVSRWGRVPHVATDPATLADGMAWVRSDNGQLRWRANGATQASMSGRSRVILTDSAQPINTSSTTDITWGTEVADLDGWTSGGSATLTVPAGFAGQYHVCYTGSWSATSGTSSGVTCVAGGTPFGSQDAGLWNITTLTFVITLAVADTLKFQVFQSSGAINISSRLELTGG
jgi:hypothetical protein